MMTVSCPNVDHNNRKLTITSLRKISQIHNACDNATVSNKKECMGCHSADSHWRKHRGSIFETTVVHGGQIESSKNHLDEYFTSRLQ